MKATVGTLLVIAATVTGCSEGARVFGAAKIGMSASQVRGLEGYRDGGTFLANERKQVYGYPGDKSSLHPEGRCYAIVVAADGTIAAKGYLDLHGHDRFVLLIRARDLQEFQIVQEEIGVPPWGPLEANEDLNLQRRGPWVQRPLPQNKRLASGVRPEDWAKLSDSLMGWPFARRSNDLRGYAAHGGEIPWDRFISEAHAGTLNTNCPDDVVGLRGRSPSRWGIYNTFFGVEIGGPLRPTPRPSSWRE